jgi:hypothetical protein
MCFRQHAMDNNNNSMTLVYFIFTTFQKNTHQNSIFKHKIFVTSFWKDWNTSQFANILHFMFKWDKDHNATLYFTSICKSSKITSIEIYESQGTILLYDINIILDSSESITNYGA